MKLKQLIEVSDAAEYDLYELLQDTDRIHVSNKDYDNSESSYMDLFDSLSDLGVGPKPNGGLWYGFGSSWIEYAPSVGKSFKYVYDVSIDKSWAITLNSQEEIDEFGRKFGITYDAWSYWYMPYGLNQRRMTDRLWDHLREDEGEAYAIWWRKVLKEYKVVEIKIDAPQGWAYGWDVPSGVIMSFNGLRDFGRKKKSVQKIFGPEDLDY